MIVTQFQAARTRFLPMTQGIGDRLVAGLGGAIGIGIMALASWYWLPPHLYAGVPWLAASMGASATLLFVVPASPLTQPWPVVGGHVVSACVGIAVARLAAPPPLVATLAVGLAILAMSALRCLHPPGGGTALMSLVGGKAVAAQGFWFALMPVGFNALLLTLTTVVFHRLVSGHSYPHRAHRIEAAAVALPDPKDVDAALAELGETIDVAREDIDELILRIHLKAHARKA